MFEDTKNKLFIPFINGKIDGSCLCLMKYCRDMKYMYYKSKKV